MRNLKPHITLLPFAWVYAIVTIVRNLFYDRGWFRSYTPPVPTIGVGNLTAGGTGKTPHVEYILSLLLQHGKRVAMISRGYGRATKGFCVVKESHTAIEVGDEPWQIKHKFPSVTVAVDSDRHRAISWLRTLQPDLQVIVLDDVFQHRSVSVGLNILLMDYSRPLWRDHLLPAGYLREIRRERRRADVIVCTKSPKNTLDIEKQYIKERLINNNQKVVFSTIQHENIYCLAEPHGERFTLDRLRERPVMLLTGIARPYALQMELSRLCKVYPFAFADHHRFTHTDLQEVERVAIPLREKEPAIVTTEKDVARLYEHPDFVRRWERRIYVLPVKVSFLAGEDLFADNDTFIFNNIINDYVNQ